MVVDMPEAIATTKRKFYRALDSITSTTSHISLAPSNSSSTTSTKRPATAAAAFDEARERVTKRLRQSKSSSSSLTSLSRRVLASASASASLKKDVQPSDPPNFSPWSHDAFLARLRTFSSVSLWHPKPEAIGEVEWAKRGWTCVDVNTVACRGGCERRLVVSLGGVKKAVAEEEKEDDDAEDDDDEKSSLEDALVQRYQTFIVEGHEENCMWRKAGCKDDIYRIQVVRPSVWHPELRNRYRSVMDVSSAVDEIKLKTLDTDESTLMTSTRLVQELPPGALGPSERSPNGLSESRALSIALHGWRGSTESGSELLRCDACFQRIGLWMYQPGYKPTISASDDEGSEDQAVVDLTEMHREHCPWRNAATQKTSGTLSGLNASQILYRVVATFSREQRRRSHEHAEPPDDEQGQQVLAERAANTVPPASREEVAQQDKERESRLRKLKKLFTIKRRPTSSTTKTRL